MSNSADMVISMLQHLNVKDAREALDSMAVRYTKDQIDLKNKVVTFIDSVELIQEKTIKQVPALFKKGI
jgi:hypothetical protein